MIVRTDGSVSGFADLTLLAPSLSPRALERRELNAQRLASIQPKHEVEVTPEMIEAGVAVLSASGMVSPHLAGWAASRLVEELFLAMSEATEMVQDAVIRVLPPESDALDWLRELEMRLSRLSDLVEKPANLVQLVRNLPDTALASILDFRPTGRAGERRIVLEPSEGLRNLMAVLRALDAEMTR